MADITSTVGTASRNYSTLQAWEDALPASAITAGNNYIAELYKDSEFVAAVPLLVAGCATDSTHTLTIRAAAGQSFRDNANVRTNLLRYNAANGVAIRGTSGYNAAIEIQVPFVTLDGLQVAHTNNGRAVYSVTNTPANITISNCVMEAPGSFAAVVRCEGVNALFQNSAILNTGGGTTLWIVGTSPKVYSSTLAKIGTAGSPGILTSTTAEIRNTVAANFATCFSGMNAANCSNNAATDATAPGAGSLQSLTLATLFEAPGTDYRTKAGAALIDAGTTIGPTVDISNTARGTVYDIGAWEVASTGGTPTPVSGTVAVTLLAPTFGASGLQTNVGTLVATLAAPTFAASGIAATPPSGTFAASLSAPVMTSAGLVLDAGQFSATLAAPSMASVGTAAPHATGTLTITMPAPTMNSFGFLGANAPAAPVRPYRWRIMRRGFAPS